MSEIEIRISNHKRCVNNPSVSPDEEREILCSTWQERCPNCFKETEYDLERFFYVIRDCEKGECHMFPDFNQAIAFLSDVRSDEEGDYKEKSNKKRYKLYRAFWE